MKSDGRVAEDDPAETVFYSQAAERLGESIAAQALPEADVFSVAFQHPDPATAEPPVAELVNQYIEAHLDAYGAPAIATFLDRRVSNTRSASINPRSGCSSSRRSTARSRREPPDHTDAVARRDPAAAIRGGGPDRGDPLAPPRRRRRRGGAQQPDAAPARGGSARGNLRRDTDKRLGVVQSFIASRRAEAEREFSVFDRKRKDLEEKLAQTEAS